MYNVKFYIYNIEYFSMARPGHIFREQYTSQLNCPNKVKKYLKKLNINVISVKRQKK